MEVNEDYPAFPVSIGTSEYSGLTKREYFAAMAMQGLLSSGVGVEIYDVGGSNTDPVVIASASISYADELLKQLES